MSFTILLAISHQLQLLCSIFPSLICSAFNEGCSSPSLSNSGGTGALRNQGICLKIFRKVGAEGPNLLIVTSHSQTSTAPATPVQVVLPEKCLVYQAPSASGGWRRWRQRSAHRCGPWTALPAKERRFCVLPGSSGAGSPAPLSSAEPQAGKLVL